MTKLGKKAQRGFNISDMGGVVIAVVVMAVILGFGATVLAKLKGMSTVNGSAANTTQFGLDGINVVSQFIPTISIVLIAAIVIGIIIFFFGRARLQQS